MRKISLQKKNVISVTFKKIEGKYKIDGKKGEFNRKWGRNNYHS